MIKHYYLCFSDDFKLSTEDVNFLLDENKKVDKAPGLIESSEDDTSEDLSIRNCSVGFSESERVKDILLPYFEKANELCGWNYDVSMIENIQFSEFSKDQYYDWHIDGGLDHFSPSLHTGSEYENLVRKLSLIVQLSKPEDYEGGDVFFSKPPSSGGLDIYGETLPQFRQQGAVIVFPSYVRHKVGRVTSGTRKAATAWHNGPPMK